MRSETGSGCGGCCLAPVGRVVVSVPGDARVERMLCTAGVLNAGQEVPMRPWQEIKREPGLQVCRGKALEPVEGQIVVLPATALVQFAEAVVVADVASWGGLRTIMGSLILPSAWCLSGLRVSGYWSV